MGLVAATSWAQCDLTLQGNDSYGDGWNGGTLTVDVNGAPTNYSVAVSTQSWTISVNTGDVVSVSWVGGSYLDEVSWSLTDDTGDVLSVTDQYSDGVKVIATIVCGSTCTAVDYPIVPSNQTTTGLDLSFVDNNASIAWVFTYRLSSDAIGTETIVPLTAVDLTGTAPNYTYSVTGLPSTPTGAEYVFSMAVNCGTEVSNGMLLIESLVPGCLLPSNLSISSASLTDVFFTWTPGGLETGWNVEYGTIGFAPGTGAEADLLAAVTNSGSFTGLVSNSIYEIYVQSDCNTDGVSAWVGPITFNTYGLGQFMDWDSQCGPGFVDIATTGTEMATVGDDGEFNVIPSFDFLFQGELVTDYRIGSNGAIVFNNPGADIGYSNSSNISTQTTGIYPYWDDLGTEETDEGVEAIYYETVGTAPNQQFIVQWNRSHISNSGTNNTIIFQIVIDEATQEIYYLYDDLVTDAGNNDNGSSATIGATGASNPILVSFDDATYLENNSCVRLYYTDCPKVVNYSVTYTTPNEAGITWNVGLAGETNWTVIYGQAGFDPTATGATINTTTPAAIIPNLNAFTTYDVYIYADCNPGVLQSTGLMGQFTTLPNCSDVTAITTLTAVDSLFTGWLWVESSGIGTYPSTGFNLQYGTPGFTLFDGTQTIVNADNNFTDTTEDLTLLSGSIYEVYVQAVCAADTSNWVGPVTFIMPISNDSTCNAINLAVDGTVYIFNNTGATTQLNETTIAPPATGFQTTDGWGNSNIDFTTWFTFTAPASGDIRIDGTDVGFDGQIAVYETTDCSDLSLFTLLGANDDAIGGGSDAPNFTLCGLTPGNTYYLMHDSWSTTATGNYSITLSEIALAAGTTTGIIDVCTGDTVNLYNGLTGNDAGGTWTEEIATANFADPLFPTAGLAYQVFNFEYRLVDGCASDSIVQQVQIYGPSNAGTDGTINVCKNQPVDLLSGLGGSFDLGGTWYDPSNAPIPSAIVAGNFGGNFNYDYIASNGVCADDTANVVVIVDGSCDYLNLQEIYFGDMEIYPNPTTGMVYISNNGSIEVFNYEITDVNGKVVATENGAINGTDTTEINLDNLDTGIYMIKVYNESAKKTFRIVKQ